MTTEYLYDANGNMVKDLNKGIDSIYYNHLNLPYLVDMQKPGDSIEYTYDAAGIKLRQRVYQADTLFKTTDYVGEFIYETIGADSTKRALQFIQHEEGRIVPETLPVPKNIYQYHLKDHLGNVRTTFTTGIYTSGFLATMEDATYDYDTTYFFNVDPRVPNPNPMGAGKVSRVNSTTSPIGPGFYTSVSRGDTIRISVKAYYEDANGWGTNSTPLATMAAALTTAYGGVNGGNEGQQLIYDVFNTFAGGMLAFGGTGDDNYPAVYLNYLIFDSEYNLDSAGHVGMPQYGPGEYVMSAENIVIAQAGHVYIYVSNESTSSQYVYFDNLNIEISEGPILESSDYYPFGMTFNAYTKPGTVEQRYKYQSKEEQEELNTIDFEARMYNPALGRTWQIDPLSIKYYDLSPYSWVANNPLIIVDPTGMELDYSQLNKDEKREFKQTFKELKKTGETGKEVVKYLKSKESGRIQLTANSGGFLGQFDANERISFDGESINLTQSGFESDEIGGTLNIDFKTIELYGENPVDVLAEEASHAAIFSAEANENGSNSDVSLARGNDEFTAKAIVGQIEKESGRAITDFGNDGTAREFGRNAFSSKSSSGFQNALRKWKSEQNPGSPSWRKSSGQAFAGWRDLCPIRFNNFSVSNLTYDLNGNVDSLTRRGKGISIIDSLVYTYALAVSKGDTIDLSVKAYYEDGNPKLAQVLARWLWVDDL